MPDLNLGVIGNSSRRRPDRSARAHRVVLPAPLRRRSGVLQPAERRGSAGRLRRDPAGESRLGEPGISGQHRGAGDDADRFPRRHAAHHRFRPALQAIRPRLPPGDADPARRGDLRPAGDPHPHPPDRRSRARAPGAHPRQQPHPLSPAGFGAPPHHRRADLLYRDRIRLRADDADQSDAGARRIRAPWPRPSRARLPGADDRLLDRVDALSLRALRMAGGGDPRRDHLEALPFRGDGRHGGGAHHLDPRGRGYRAQLGLSRLLDARCLSRRSRR